MKICRTYWNAVTRKYGYIERKNLHGRFEFFAIHDKQVNPYPTFGAAYDELKQAGYEPMGFLDETGARRYTMTLPELERVYKAVETFVADCTQREYNENKSAIIAVYTLLHKHINAEIKK